HHLAQHPVPAHHQYHGHARQLGHERERHLLDLRDRLHDRHRQPDDQRHDQDGRGQFHRDEHRLQGDLDNGGVGHRKLASRERTTSAHPSTITNSRSLNGSDTSTGGSIIMPIDMSDELTIRSMTRKGTNTTKPMMKAVFNSLSTKAG